jgi:ribonucleotide reductase alpha subunit
MSDNERKQLVEYIKEMKFIPGGRYLYYAGREYKAYNNCYLLRAEEDTREEWSAVTWRAMSCLMTGGGIGIDYSRLRPAGKALGRTGGTASGPVPLMSAINEIGRNVMQGGSRRSAIYASLNWQHEDIKAFLHVKDWKHQPIGTSGLTAHDIKQQDFNFAAPLDMTNISVNYDDAWNFNENNPVFLENCRQALMTGEPGFSFNFGSKQNETLRNACVPGETPILTSSGYKQIQDRVGQITTIWNGIEWSDVVPFSTGINSTVLVSLSDGTSLECTPYHKWCLADGSRVEARDLQVGNLLAKFEMPIIKSPDYCVNVGVSGYSQGFYSGDGNTGLNHSWIYKPKESVIPFLKGKVSSFNEKTNRYVWTHGQMLPKDYVPIGKYQTYCLEWLAGLIDSDGTVTRDINGNGIQICSTNRKFLLDVRLMLTQLGCRAKVVSGDDEGLREMPDGKGGSAEYYCKETHRLLIGNTDTYSLIQQGLCCHRAVLHGDKPQRDARRFVTVVSVESAQNAVETFCFTDAKNGTGTFNGIVTGNCTEVTSEDDSDVCNLGSINMGNIKSLEEFQSVVSLASKFLVCGTLRADLPYTKVYKVREKNRRLGLGLMGIHEWLLQRKLPYQVNETLHEWLKVYRDESKRAADEHCDRFFLSHPVAYRAIAPTGSIGILAGTTTGIEPLFAVAYKRRFLTEGTKWKYQYVVDGTASGLISKYGVDPSSIESALDLSTKYEQRIAFQADIQDYVDMSISSTINLPAWGSEDNNETKVQSFAETLAKYAPRLRGFTCYPDGSRGGQPLTSVPYEEALQNKDVIFDEVDICSITGKGGTCGA